MWYEQKPKIKMTHSGQPCRKCGTPVVIVKKPEAQWTAKPGRRYCKWWLKCPLCRVIYLQNEAIVLVPDLDSIVFDIDIIPVPVVDSNDDGIGDGLAPWDE